MQPKFEEKEGFYLVGVADRFERGKTENIGKHLWPEFSRRFNEIPNKKGRNQNGFRTYGVSQDIWIGGHFQDHFKYLAAVEVDAGTTPPKGMELIKIEKQYYAIFIHRDGLKKLQDTIKYIWGTWMPKSGCELSPASDLEVYPSDFSPIENEVPFEIWVSLIKR